MIKSKRNVLNNICRKHGLKLILLHGSQVSGQVHAKSDVDIAVLPQFPAKKLDYLNLISDLTDFFHNDQVDLTDLSRADPLLLKLVIDHSRLLAGSKKDLDKIQLKAFHRYNDYLPYLKQEQQTIKKTFAHYDAD